jgi:hypothetical protein
MIVLMTWTATVALSLGFWTMMIAALARLIR